jgi:hypothetical protein
MAEVQNRKIDVELVADRVTKGAVRFMEPGNGPDPLSVYLRKGQVEALGLPIAEGSTILAVIYAKPSTT